MKYSVVNVFCYKYECQEDRQGTDALTERQEVTEDRHKCGKQAGQSAGNLYTMVRQ